MIPRYTDLAANERTYLAWIRTALSLIAFGFLLERFDMLVHCFARGISEAKMNMIPPHGREAGLLLAALGLLIMILSTIRFVTTTRLLKSEKEEAYATRSVLITGTVFILLALFVLLYLANFLSLGSAE